MPVLKTRPWPQVVRVARSPAAWCFAICWLPAVALLAMRGFADRALGGLWFSRQFCCWLTVVLTADPPPAAHKPGPRIALQTGVVLAIPALVGLPAMIPIWS